MNREKVVGVIKKIVKKELGQESSGHDFFHCQRVVNITLKIGKKEKADLFILQLAGWLHDIDVKKGRDGHHLRSAKVASEILGKLGVSQDIIKQVKVAIRAHSYRGAKDNPAKTLEAKIISDADKLDVMGALGVARVCSFSGYFGRPLHKPEHQFDPQAYRQTGSTTAIGAFYEKIFLLPKVLYTKEAKKIGKKRLKFAHQFVKQFLKEWNGKDC